MPHLPLRKIVPGVRPDDYDVLVFWVQSDSRPNVEHRVDRTSYDGRGACSCEAFTFNGKRTCKHLRRVMQYQSFEITFIIMDQREAAGNENKKAARERDAMRWVAKQEMECANGPARI